MMTGVDLTRRSSGVLLDQRRDSDPRTTGSLSTTSSEKMDSILSSLIETPPPGYPGSPSSYDPALDTYIHSGMWQTPSLRERLDSTSSAMMSQCRRCARTSHSTDGSHSERTSPKRTQPRNHARKTTTTSTASGTSSLPWTTFLMLRWRIGAARILIPRLSGHKNTSTKNLNLPSSGRLLVATSLDAYRLQSGKEEL